MMDTLIPCTVEAMIDCNNLSYQWRKVYYTLKDKILMRYGTFCDLTRQQWYDETWVDDYIDSNDEGYKDSYAIHVHVLERWLLGSVFFHKPTDEFYYHNYNLGVTKESRHFREMVERCLTEMAGKKKDVGDNSKNNAAFQSLKWLMRQYGDLYRQEYAAKKMQQASHRRAFVIAKRSR